MYSVVLKISVIFVPESLDFNVGFAFTVKVRSQVLLVCSPLGPVPVIFLLLVGTKVPSPHLTCISSLSFTDPTISAKITLDLVPFSFCLPFLNEFDFKVPCSGTKFTV